MMLYTTTAQGKPLSFHCPTAISPFQHGSTTAPSTPRNSRGSALSMTCTAELSSRKTSRRVSCRAPRLTRGISSYKKRHASFRFGSSTIAWISKQNTQPSSDVLIVVKSRRAWGGLQNSPSFLKRLDLRWFLNVTWWFGGFPKKGWNYWFAFRLSPNILPSTKGSVL